MAKKNDTLKKPSLNDIRMMVSAAHLCYEKGLTQEEASAILGVSRPKVSRLLSQAREQGIVEIIVRNPISQNTMVQASLIETYGLLDAVVTPYIFDSQDVILPNIGAAAAQYIMENLPERVVLGMGRGFSVFEVVKNFSPYKNQRPKVVPLSGAVGEFDSGIPLEEIINRTASAFAGQRSFLYAPALLQKSKYRQSILVEPSSVETVKLWDKLDWAVFGIGTIHQFIGTNERYDRALKAFVREVGTRPVADINLRFILPDGRMPVTSHNDHLIAASADQIRNAKIRLAVAGGSIKLNAIYAALLSGLINVLVTDEQTAEGLIQLKA